MSNDPDNQSGLSLGKRAGTLAGQILGGTYLMGPLLGEGGMGAVYEAQHTRIPKRFAIKVLQRVLAQDPEVRTRFEREAMIGSMLGHDHIVQVVDFNHTPDGKPYIVMELLAGRDLATTVAKEGPLGVPRALAIARQVALALADAHEHGVIHRDLKPENIFLTQRADGSECAKVLDFGLSKILSDEITSVHSVFGTPWYMAPEQARGQTALIDGRTDIFALGLVLYFMLSGRSAFVGAMPAQVLTQIVHGEPTPLGDLRRDLDPRIQALVARSIEKQREARFPTARHLIAELDRVHDPGDSPQKTLPPVAVEDGPTLIGLAPALSPSDSDPTEIRVAPALTTEPALAFVPTEVVEEPLVAPLAYAPTSAAESAVTSPVGLSAPTVEVFPADLAIASPPSEPRDTLLVEGAPRIVPRRSRLWIVVAVGATAVIALASAVILSGGPAPEAGRSTGTAARPAPSARPDATPRARATIRDAAPARSAVQRDAPPAAKVEAPPPASTPKKRAPVPSRKPKKTLGNGVADDY